MVRIAAVILAVLALMGTHTIATAQKSSSSGCYNAATCETDCSKSAVGKNCHKACAHRQATQPACK
jgi:hypothetical protein